MYRVVDPAPSLRYPPPPPPADRHRSPEAPPVPPSTMAEPRPKDPEPTHQGPVIVARDLTKRYGRFTAVDGIQFEVRKGECFGLLGPNGAGKTSTMKMVYGACGVTSGVLEVMGRDVSSDLREVKRRLGVVPQEENLDEDLTVLENLLVYARYFDRAWPATEPRAGELLGMMQLSEKADERVDRLSGGMKRRLLIARSLIAEPRILILDEPTVGLDPQARHLLWEILQKLRERGLTLVLTTHYMDEAERLCDRLVVMDHGVIIKEGAPQELIAEIVGAEVLELDLPAAREQMLLAAVGDAAEGHERASNRFLLYGPDAEEILHRIRRSDIEPEQVLVRRATLEDVFMRLTGRELKE